MEKITHKLLDKILDKLNKPLVKAEQLDFGHGKYFDHVLKHIPLNLDLFEHLKQLNLSYNYIKKIDNLQNLSKLTLLDLSFNQIQKLENIGHLRQLKSLNLNNNKIHLLTLEIQSICGLEELKLSNNCVWNIHEIILLKKLNKLKLLTLDGNPIMRLPRIDIFI